MAGIRRRLADRYSVTTFDYPYIAEGRRAPDRMETLVGCHRAVVGSIRGSRMVLGGKSMGGRIASHVGSGGVDAMFFLGYPLLPIGKSAPRDTSHLDLIGIPMLFVQGERDRLGPPDMIGRIAARLAHASMVVIPEADHSFKVPKRSGGDLDGVLDRLAGIIVEWLAGLTG